MPLASLVLDLEAGEAEPLSEALIDQGALSVSAEDAAAGTDAEAPLFDEPGSAGMWSSVRLQVLVADSVDPVRLLERACRAAGVARPKRVTLAALGERDWVRESQEQFEPVRISDRLWVVPSWREPPPEASIAVRIDPGMAFGTGAHPTTRLCLAWLDTCVRGGQTILDFGCGSGILAIAAMKLGAARALGVDIDPVAVQAARENAVRNGVACEFRETNAPLGIDADIVVANILANPLKMLAPVLARHVRPGGWIALSGILQDQVAEMTRVYSRWFEFDAPARDEGWACLAGRRNDAL